MAFFWAVIVGIVVGILSYVLYMYRKIASEEGGPLQYKKDIKLTGKTVLITGANCGLGKGAALELAARGARVVLACRNKEKAEAAAEEIKKETGNEDVSIVMLDLADFDSVRAAAEYIYKTYDRLDVLINNAAVGFTDPIPTKQGFDMNFGTNYLGHFLFTHLLIDLLKKSAPSRIVNVSSKSLMAIWGKLNYRAGNENEGVRFPHLQGYPISKLSNYYHVKTLSDLLKGTGITANAVHPGYVQTEIMKREVQDTIKSFLNKSFLFGSKVIGRSIKDGCQTLVHAAVEPELEQVTGQFFINMTNCTDQLPALARDDEEARKLRDFSCAVCEVTLMLSEDSVETKNAADEKTDDRKEDEDGKKDEETKEDKVTKEVEPEQKEEESQMKSAAAVFATNIDQEMTEISEAASKETLEDITTPPDNKIRGISPFKCEITTIPASTIAEEIASFDDDDTIYLNN